MSLRLKRSNRGREAAPSLSHGEPSAGGKSLTLVSHHEQCGINGGFKPTAALAVCWKISPILPPRNLISGNPAWVGEAGWQEFALICKNILTEQENAGSEFHCFGR